MSRLAYVNGAFLRNQDALVHIEDRGFQFGDGVYEVCLHIDGALWDAKGHFARLRRSLAELEINLAITDRALAAVFFEIVRRNRLRDALVYLQVTRGVAMRNHAFPKNDTPSTLIVTARHFELEANEALAVRGVPAITVDDERWDRVDIKTINLLPNCIAKQSAVSTGATEAILVRNGVVTEGSSTNVWIVEKSGAVRTHPLSNHILGGITRDTVISCAAALGLKCLEKPFTVDEVLSASEVFLTSATSMVMPVVRVNDTKIAGGRPGPVSARLRKKYQEIARAAALAR